jgi:hypothetical protein
MQIFYISYSLILTIITCIILVFMNKLIDKYYSIITFNLNWIILDFIFLLYSVYITNSLWMYSIFTLYLSIVYIITKIGNSGKSFIFGILIALFQSEYWEIFIHFYWNEIFISTIVMSICIIYTMAILKLDYINFIYNVLIFSVFYFTLVNILYPTSIFREYYIISDFFFRIIFSIFSILFIYYNNKTYKVNKSTIIGGTPESS